MKRIGILGGLSAESTLSYYARITREYIRRFGEPRYPEIVIFSVNFQEYSDWQHDGKWDKCAEHMIHALDCLEKAGSDFAIIATNTMHYVLPEVRKHARLPVLSIMDCVADSVRAQGLKKVALLGTGFTMSKSFYQDALKDKGISCLIPDEHEREEIHRAIYEELVNGVIKEESRQAFYRIIDRLIAVGAEGVIMGCTEIPLLLRQEDVKVPLFDSATIHADAALLMALAQ
jgi:aspartate racemase